MIIGLLSDVYKHKAVLPAVIFRALDALQKLDLSRLEPGRYELEGDKLFYLVQDAQPRAFDDSKAEAHRSYADIQIPISACERFGFSLPEPGLMPTDNQLEENDIAFYPKPSNEFFMDIAPGAFLVFLPNELHRPCLAIKNQNVFRKVVVKVHASLLEL